jgi:hypothetical protein
VVLIVGVVERNSSQKIRGDGGKNPSLQKMSSNSFTVVEI